MCQVGYRAAGLEEIVEVINPFVNLLEPFVRAAIPRTGRIGRAVRRAVF